MDGKRIYRELMPVCLELLKDSIMPDMAHGGC